MSDSDLISIEHISNQIYTIRGIKVMLDRDLADLYDVETKVLKRNVRRNIDRFPNDFMFELTKEEIEVLRCQIGTLKRGQHSKYLPFAFTEQGVAMLSGILNSKRAIQVNIRIMRTFTQLRHALLETNELKTAVEKLKDQMNKRFEQTDERFEIVFSVLDTSV